MRATRPADLLAGILVFAGGVSGGPLDIKPTLTGWQKALLAASCVGAYAAGRVVFGLLGLPAVPGESSLLLSGQPAYGLVVAVLALVAFTLLARPVVGRVRPDAPLLVAAVGLVALPVHAGDFRDALFDAGGASIYLTMLVELLVLTAGMAVAYGLLGVLAARAAAPADAKTTSAATDAVSVPQDTAGDRLAAVGVQAMVVLALMALIGQTPLKGQAVFGIAVAGYAAAWVTFKTRQTAGSAWPIAGTLLAGVVAYAWSFMNPDGLAIGDVRHSLAGAAYVLPLHYATSGVAGTLYGHWAATTGDLSPVDQAA